MKRMTTSTLVAAMLLFVFGCALTNLHSRHEAQKEIFLPPHGLIKSNYEQASFVVVLQITSEEIGKTIFADDGSPGYIITRENGKVMQSFKGDLKVGEEIVFHDWLEYSPNWKNARVESLLVFLKQDANVKDYKTIAEAAVFPYSSELVKMVNDIVGEKKMDKSQNASGKD